MTAAVTPLEARCEVCHGTGSKSGFVDGDLDCNHCNAAQERIGLRALLGLSSSADDSEHWRAYVLGYNIGLERAAGAPVVPVAAQPAWKALSDVQWMNIVNHDHAYYLHSKEEAVHLAVKMTEKKCKELNAGTVSPVDMILHCPVCHVQHIDAPDDRTSGWSNPPHRSHLCHECGHIWRPADVATNGVDAIKTKGSADSKTIAAPSLEAQPAGEVVRDAKRWHQMLRHVGADQSPAMGVQYFVFRGIHAEPGVNLMRGSVAEHFTDAIDKAMAQGDK